MLRFSSFAAAFFFFFLQLLRDEKAVHAFLRFIIQVLVSAPDNLVGYI